MMMISLEGNVGTSPIEVFLVTFFVPASSLLMLIISSIFYSDKIFVYLEVVILNVVLLLILTSFSDHLLLLFIIYIILLAFAFWFAFHKFTFREINLKIKDWAKEKDVNRSYIGDYRGHLLLATSICILAVDFRIFPSKFAKTEMFGWSVMDAGVGSFVLLHGLCSAHGKQLKENSMKKCFKTSFPLLILGFLRLALTTSVGYHKVVQEYGIHWNFFFTLAFTKVMCSSILAIFKVNAGLLAVIIVIIHQFLLTKLGLSDFVSSPERRNLLEANKEGICSLLGFVSLYFFGVQLGHVAWGKKDYCYLLVKLCCLGLCGWILMLIFHENCQHVSRRMANLSYCIWIVSLTSLQISLHLCHFLIVDIIKKLLKVKLHENLLWNVLNYNGLFYFLLANLMTGLVNITINTADTSNSKSLCILFMYLTILFGSSFILFKLNIKFLRF
ncbi:phosphatidylinositol-glycan biosynthesis class W protein [Parasteatoda tepidariorum]|uniref:phosphatidylinositol-glycan biosynthesis class W protein n=1 Tax=Parasteatoda tepidariorum TaxID=114398 RepID=UPI001C71D187|nr:phosphatidylinositol-glycan biosynthesis class W protein [Parasteatoda tepidariorum]XP_042910602.1 phosphatidylinositol-glycan biosynthesis class W protein [Parasteatoda tepidariorum]